jgi:hypothetical protein
MLSDWLSKIMSLPSLWANGVKESGTVHITQPIIQRHFQSVRILVVSRILLLSKSALNDFDGDG